MDDTPIPGFRYLVKNPERLAGKPTVKGTRFAGLSHDDIVREYSDFPRDSIPEVLRFAAEVIDRADVAA